MINGNENHLSANQTRFQQSSKERFACVGCSFAFGGADTACGIKSKQKRGRFRPLFLNLDFAF